MSDFGKLLADVHNIYLDYRSLDRLVTLDNFLIAWENASDTARDDVQRFLLAGSVDGVKNWIRHWEKRELDDLSFRRLREKASEANVVNYSRMTRVELVQALKEIKDGV